MFFSENIAPQDNFEIQKEDEPVDPPPTKRTRATYSVVKKKTVNIQTGQILSFTEYAKDQPGILLSVTQYS